jgi:hypothetical protein
MLTGSMELNSAWTNRLVPSEPVTESSKAEEPGAKRKGKVDEGQQILSSTMSSAASRRRAGEAGSVRHS